MICCILIAIVFFVIGISVIAALLIDFEPEGFVPVEGELAPITIITADRDNV